MIIPDINILIYAIVSGAPRHEAARRWLEGHLSSAIPMALPLPTLFGFIRLATNRHVLERPLLAADAIAYVDDWRTCPNVEILHPGPRHLEIAFSLIRHLGVAANLTTDIQLAALALEYQAELHSADGDFSRFPGLRWRNPLI